jgi:hypothetical protein
MKALVSSTMDSTFPIVLRCPLLDFNIIDYFIYRRI